MSVPTLVYDDDCGFCTWAVEYLARRGEFEVVGFSELTPEQRASLPGDYERCAHLLADDGVYSCDEAMEEAFARIGRTPREAVDALRRLPGYETARGATYRWIARNRGLLGRALRSEPPARVRRD